MDRSISVEVRDNTWPPIGTLPAFPASFHRGHTTWNMNVAAMLLKIGYLTTPTYSTGVSLSEFWAWVRYLSAVTNDTDLRLTQSFAELDAHQKTILSDDFGMGVPMLWLDEHINLDRVLDGRYFMQRVAASVGATQYRTAKRGPNKTPDFVARGTDGVWHIIECKGTQSSAQYSETQIGEVGPPPIGGIAQKKSILFPPAYTGQRLVSALQIGVEGGEPSRLIIVDPKPEKPFSLTEKDMEFADDSATRAVASRALRLSGFEMTAEVVASPTGPRPDIISYERKSAERERQESVEERDGRARSELKSIRQRTPLFEGKYIGREMTVELPRPIFIGDDRVTKVTIQQGMKREVLEEMSEQPTVNETISSSKTSWEKNIGINKAFGEELNAQLTIGDFFRSEISFEKA